AAIAGAGIERIAVLRIGASAAPSAAAVLEAAAPMLSPGATVIVEGIADAAVDQANGAARQRLGMTAAVERFAWNALTWQLPTDWAPGDDGHRPAASIVPAPASTLPSDEPVA